MWVRKSHDGAVLVRGTAKRWAWSTEVVRMHSKVSPNMCSPTVCW